MMNNAQRYRPEAYLTNGSIHVRMVPDTPPNAMWVNIIEHEKALEEQYATIRDLIRQRNEYKDRCGSQNYGTEMEALKDHIRTLHAHIDEGLELRDINLAVKTIDKKNRNYEILNHALDDIRDVLVKALKKVEEA